MSLNLYRRHGSNCFGGRSLHEMTYAPMSSGAIGNDALALSTRREL
jgi:hypothetical protein